MKPLGIILFICLGTAVFSQGLIFDPDWYEKQPIDTLKLRSLNDNTLRPSFSLTPFLPDLNDQLSNNTCGPYSYSHYYGIRYNYLTELDNEIDGGQRLFKSFSGSFIANTLNICDTGISFQTLFDFALNKGICEKKVFGNYPSCHTKPEPNHFDNAYLYKLADRERVLDKSQGKKKGLSNIKERIQAGFPVLVGMTITENFKSCNNCEFWKPQEKPLKSKDGELLGHAMVVVGFNGAGAQGYFELLNSYGKDWGVNGIAKIDYNDFWRQIQEAFIIYLNCGN